MCWDLSVNLRAGWITYKSRLKPIKMSEFLLCLNHCEMLIGIVFDLTAAWGCYCYWGVKLGSDLLVIVVRCVSACVNGVKMRMGLKRLGPFICSGCKVHYSQLKRDQKRKKKSQIHCIQAGVSLQYALYSNWLGKPNHPSAPSNSCGKNSFSGCSIIDWQ